MIGCVALPRTVMSKNIYYDEIDKIRISES